MPAIIGCCWRRAICRNGCLAVCSGGSLGCRFRRDSRGCGSREIDPDQQRREGCLTKPDGKAVVSSLGTRVGADGTLVPSPGPSQRKNSALDSLAGYIVWGCWELKRKFRLKGPATMSSTNIGLHCCPVKSQTESVGYRFRVKLAP